MTENPTTATLETHSLSKNMKDKYVYYIKTDSDQCPKCGMHGAISKGECQSCGCWIEFNNDLAGQKKPLSRVTRKKQKPQRQQKPAPKNEDDEEPEDPPGDDDFSVEPAKVTPRELAIALLKKAKAIFKENEGLLKEHFSGVVVTFDPFLMKVQEKPRAIDI